MRLSRLRSLALVTIASLAAGGALVVPLAHADSKVDCSGIKIWSSGQHYSHNTRVWFKGNYSHGARYTCTDDSFCSGAPNSSSDWSLDGECIGNTEPH